MFLVPLDQKSDVSLQTQIYSFLRERIIQRDFPFAMRLPSSRELAASLKVSRNTVLFAYDWLESEGYIEKRRGSGAYVAFKFDDEPVKRGSPENERFNFQARSRIATAQMPVLGQQKGQISEYDFWYGAPDPRVFPIRRWKQIISSCLDAGAPQLSVYPTQQGELSLREQIALQLTVSKGLPVDPDQIIITSGAQEAINLISSVFVQKGDKVAIEQPGYQTAAKVFRSRGAILHGLLVDDEGVVPDTITTIQPNLIYVTPSHQFPMGNIMSQDRRSRLLQAATMSGAVIIEDDYDGEIIFDRPPVAALAALAPNRNVFYVGSFSKILAPGLRLGFIAAPKQFVEALVSAKAYGSYGQSWLEQAALAEFIKSGDYNRHLRRVRKQYRARRDACTLALKDLFGDQLYISGAEAGLHVLAVLPHNWPNASRLKELATDVGVTLYPMTQAGVFDAHTFEHAEQALIIGYARHSPKEIRTAFQRVRVRLEASKLVPSAD